MRAVLIALCMMSMLLISNAADTSPVQNSVLSGIQGGTTDGSDSKGVFSNGFGGSNGQSQASQLQSDIMAAPPSVKANVASALGSYGVALPAPAPSFRSSLTSLAAADQQSLFASLLTELTSPAPAPAQQQAASVNTNTVGFGDTSGGTSSSGSRKMLK